MLVMLAALGLYYFHFYSTNPDQFAVDGYHHMQYVEHFVKFGETPNPAEHAAYRHPPLYYAAAAELVELGQGNGAVPAIYLARHLSMVLYLVYLTFGALLLRSLMPQGTLPFQASLTLLAFWPVAATFGARISCDLLSYAGQLGTIYFIARWIQRQEIPSLTGAFLCAGASVLAKNSGVIFLGVAGLFLLHAAWLNRRHLRALLRPGLFASILFALFSAYVTIRRAWLFHYVSENYKHVKKGGGGTLLHDYLTFNPLLFLTDGIFDVHFGTPAPLFWQWFMRTILLGDFIEWNAISLLIPLAVVWLAMVAYILVGLPQLRHSLSPREKWVFAFFALLAGCMLFSMMTLRVRTNLYPYGDARYAWPVLVMILCAYGKVMQAWERKGNLLALRIGNGLAAAMVMLSVGLFVAQHLLLHAMR